MIETLKQAGMIIVLVLLSEGLFLLSRAWRHGETPGSTSIAKMGFIAGMTLCSSALMLLYALGRRDEK